MKLKENYYYLSLGEFALGIFNAFDTFVGEVKNDSLGRALTRYANEPEGLNEKENDDIRINDYMKEASNLAKKKYDEFFPEYSFPSEVVGVITKNYLNFLSFAPCVSSRKEALHHWFVSDLFPITIFEVLDFVDNSKVNGLKETIKTVLPDNSTNNYASKAKTKALDYFVNKQGLKNAKDLFDFGDTEVGYKKNKENTIRDWYNGKTPGFGTLDEYSKKLVNKELKIEFVMTLLVASVFDQITKNLSELGFDNEYIHRFWWWVSCSVESFGRQVPLNRLKFQLPNNLTPKELEIFRVNNEKTIAATKNYKLELKEHNQDLLNILSGKESELPYIDEIYRGQIALIEKRHTDAFNLFYEGFKESRYKNPKATQTLSSLALMVGSYLFLFTNSNKTDLGHKLKKLRAWALECNTDFAVVVSSKAYFKEHCYFESFHLLSDLTIFPVKDLPGIHCFWDESDIWEFLQKITFEDLFNGNCYYILGEFYSPLYLCTYLGSANDLYPKMPSVNQEQFRNHAKKLIKSGTDLNYVNPKGRSAFNPIMNTLFPKLEIIAEMLETGRVSINTLNQFENDTKSATILQSLLSFIYYEPYLPISKRLENGLKKIKGFDFQIFPDGRVKVSNFS